MKSVQSQAGGIDRAMETQPHRTLFTLMGVPWRVNADSWKFVPPKMLIGLMVALVFLPDFNLAAKIAFGFLYGLLLLLLLVLHIIGHTLSGKLIGAVMDENVVTPMLIVTTYHNDPPDLPRRVHLIRALGGPITNIIIGLLTLLLWTQVSGHVLLYFAIANFALAGFVLLPLPTVDGEVIWRIVLGRD